MQENQKEGSYSFKIVNHGEFEYDESIPAENSREISTPVMSFKPSSTDEFLRRSSKINLTDSDSEEEILIREPSANPRRFQTNKDVLQLNTEERTGPDLEVSRRKTSPGKHSTYSDSEPESENVGEIEKSPKSDEYSPEHYEHLDVSSDIKELFQYITKYSPQHLNLDCKLKAFVPDFIPAVGDIDAFLKVLQPGLTPDGEVFDMSKLYQLGLTVLDEPAINQSDRALLHLQLRASSFNVGQLGDEAEVIKKIERVDQNFKVIDKWIKDVLDLHKSKSPPVVRYSKPMPDIDDLMQEWSEEMESLLKFHGFPSWKIECSIMAYADIVCSVLDVPIYKNVRVESLHVLFCLYAAIKSFQFYKTNSVADNSSDNIPSMTTNITKKTDQLVIE